MELTTTFDWADVGAIGVAFALMSIYWFIKPNGKITKRQYQLPTALTAVAVIATITATGSYDTDDTVSSYSPSEARQICVDLNSENFCDDRNSVKRAIVQPYSELREPIDLVIQPDELIQAGKIFVHQNLLLINDVNRGVHIFDNSDPKNPQAIGFIPVLGNLDISIKNDTLFVDNFIDLVALDISNLPEVKESKRIENVFPYNPYQLINDDDILLVEVKDELGVVIGFRDY